MTHFKRLFSQAKMGPLSLSNRLVMPPMTTNLAGQDGMVTDRLINYYAARASGGVGMIIVELAIISRDGKRLPNNVGVWSDEHIPGLSRLAQAIRTHGVTATLQIGHGGRESNSIYTGLPPVSPSDLPSLFRGTTTDMERPVQLDQGGIRRLQEDFVKAALRAQSAGFQAVELHGCHGYLISQFLSPYSNKRTDKYGGSVENRTRFLVDIIKGIKSECGPGFGVIARINGRDYVPDGNTESESAMVAHLAQTAGADAIHVSAGFHESRPYRILPGPESVEACYVPLAAAVKAKVEIPVIAVARIGRPQLAEEILAADSADLIAMGRALICAPDLPRKAEEGHTEEIRWCIWCNQGCIGQIHVLKPISCLQNPSVGCEGEIEAVPTVRPQKVLIIGGGPAGLASTLAAATIGHQVTLVEKEDHLGGQMRLAHLPPTRAPLELAITNLVKSIQRTGTEIITGHLVDEAFVRDFKPDRIILACGARPLRPQIDGLETAEPIFAAQALTQQDRVGEKVAVIGGGLVGAEVSDFLAGRGKHVVLLEMKSEIVSDAVTSTRVYLSDQLAAQGVRVICSARVVGMGSGRVSYVQDGWLYSIEGIESTVVAVGVEPERTLAAELTEKGYDFTMVGDCLTPGDAMSAIHQGYLAGIGRPIVAS